MRKFITMLLFCAGALALSTSCNDDFTEINTPSATMQTRAGGQRVESLIQQARAGDSEANKALALCYRDGDGVKKKLVQYDVQQPYLLRKNGQGFQEYRGDSRRRTPLPAHRQDNRQADSTPDGKREYSRAGTNCTGRGQGNRGHKRFKKNRTSIEQARHSQSSAAGRGGGQRNGSDAAGILPHKQREKRGGESRAHTHSRQIPLSISAFRPRGHRRLYGRQQHRQAAGDGRLLLPSRCTRNAHPCTRRQAMRYAQTA